MFQMWMISSNIHAEDRFSSHLVSTSVTCHDKCGHVRSEKTLPHITESAVGHLARVMIRFFCDLTRYQPLTSLVIAIMATQIQTVIAFADKKHTPKHKSCA